MGGVQRNKSPSSPPPPSPRSVASTSKLHKRKKIQIFGAAARIARCSLCSLVGAKRARARQKIQFVPHFGRRARSLEEAPLRALARARLRVQGEQKHAKTPPPPQPPQRPPPPQSRTHASSQRARELIAQAARTLFDVFLPLGDRIACGARVWRPMLSSLASSLRSPTLPSARATVPSHSTSRVAVAAAAKKRRNPSASAKNTKLAATIVVPLDKLRARAQHICGQFAVFCCSSSLQAARLIDAPKTRARAVWLLAR